MEELYHHGIKGQKWGVRRYQYADGSVTPAGAKRYYTNRNEPTIKRVSSLAGMKATELTNIAKTKITGKQYVDTYLKKRNHVSKNTEQQRFRKLCFLCNI